MSEWQGNRRSGYAFRGEQKNAHGHNIARSIRTFTRKRGSLQR
jgi:hypothetical protein